MATTSATPRPKKWGVTAPRSLVEPTMAERESTDGLVEVLAQFYPHKREEERHRQIGAPAKLAEIVKDWVKELATERVKEFATKRAKEVNAKLFTFGSYCLRVDEPWSVIDTLCVGPNFVNRKHDFLNVLPRKLEKMSEVEGLERVPDAIIPFLSFKLDEVPIKLVFANIPCIVIPEDLDISNDSVLKNIDDDVTLRSLSACRVTLSILELVPNLEVSGFLDESAWCIMVARVCQAYPTALPSHLVTQFFDIFANWYWPNPVMLCHIEDKRLCKQKVWDPMQCEADTAHCMPIITPAYPCTNLTSDATESTLRAMKEHFKFGDEKCKELKNNSANWQDFFVPFNFFEKYMRYLHIDAIVVREENLRTLKSWIEPKLRLLISKIERNKMICHPCPAEFASSDSSAFFIGLSSEKVLKGIEFANIVRPLTEALESEFNRWESKTPDMVLRIAQVGNMQTKSLTWGKSRLPVV